MGTSRDLRRRILRTGASLALAAAMFSYALPLMADYGDAWRHVRGIPEGGAFLLALVGVWNLATYCFLLMAALPGLTFVRAALASQASTAVSNTVPGGAALGAGLTWTMYRSFGHSREAIARSLAVTGFWNVAVKLAMPAAAVIALASGDDAPRPMVALVSLAALALVIGAGAAALHGPGPLHALGRTADRCRALFARRGTARSMWRWIGRAERARADTVDLVRDRWLSLSTTAVLSHASLFAVLVVCLRQVGVDSDVVSLGEVLTAFALVRAALIVPLTPGGAGLTEAGLSGLIITAGADPPAAVAAVLLFRAITWLLPIPLGAAAYVVWVVSRQRGRVEVPV